MTHSAFYLCWWNGKRFQQIVKFKKVKSPWWQFLLQRKNLILYWQIFSLSLCKKIFLFQNHFSVFSRGFQGDVFVFSLKKFLFHSLSFRLVGLYIYRGARMDIVSVLKKSDHDLAWQYCLNYLMYTTGCTKCHQKLPKFSKRN